MMQMQHWNALLSPRKVACIEQPRTGYRCSSGENLRPGERISGANR